MTSSVLMSPGGGTATVQDSPLLTQQIEELKSICLATHQSKCALEGAKMKEIMASLPPLNVPRKPIGLQSQTGMIDFDQMSHKKHDELNQLLRETARLQKVRQCEKEKRKFVSMNYFKFELGFPKFYCRR